MIIKSSRIPPRRTATISRYLVTECGTETVSWLRGDRDSIALMGLTAKTAGKVYGVRHIVIAPEIAMDDPELEHVLGHPKRIWVVAAFTGPSLPAQTPETAGGAGEGPPAKTRLVECAPLLAR